MGIPSAVQIACDLVRMETINPPGNERECTDYLGALLEEAGFTIDCHDYAQRRTSLIARLPGNGRRAPICFGGHVDVVPLGDAPWSVPPFAAEIADGRLYGRGSSDMKGGVAAYVHAGLVLAGEPRGDADIVLVVVAGEETGCDGSKYLASIGALPTAGAIVIAEPTSNYPYLGHRGALWLEGIARGKTAHGSMPELGDNAIYKAARAVAKLEGFAFDGTPDDLLGATTLNVGTFAGGININSVPDLARFTVDIRTIPGHDHGDILKNLRTLLGDEIELDPVVDVGPVLTSASDPWIREIYQHMQEVLGETPEPRGAPYFTDASALTPACGAPPTIILGPGEMAQAHQTDEFCHVDRIEEAAEIYAAIARRWGGLMP